MKVIKIVSELRAVIKEAKRLGKTVGLVPTMGFLHEGHLALMKKAKDGTDVVVTSIFVNPTQFSANEDLDSYPKDIKRDMELTQEAGVDYLFIPSVEEMYPEGYSTYVKVEGNITEQLCGITRSHHFRGVATIVTKLFNMVLPDYAYFGQKDAQQVIVIEKMTRDLNMDINIVACPTVREEDGLAMSSRNKYLSSSEREKAVILSKSLFEVEKKINNGERDATALRNYIVEQIKSVKEADIDYIEVVNAETLHKIKTLKGDVLIAMAVFFGKTRLIDNIRVQI